MQRPRLISLIAIIATAMLLVPTIVRAQERDLLNVGASASATVKAVDPDKRTVTLDLSDGESTTITCGSEVRNFDQIKVGDQVRAVATEQMVVAVGKGDNTGIGDAAVIARTPRGDKPGVLIAGSEQINAKISAVDPDNRTVTLDGVEGQTQPIKVSADVDLKSLSKGDEVSLRVTKGVVLWVQSPGDAARPAGAMMTPAGAGAAELAGLDVESATATATVEAVDADKRIVTLKGPTGRTRQLHLGKEAINFDQIKVGDKVRATMAEEVVVAVSKGGAAPGASEGTVITRAPQGSKPGILIAEWTQVTGKVQSVDPDKRTITLTDADGKPRTIKVGSKVNLAELKSGDDITARVTQALAIVVEKP